MIYAGARGLSSTFVGLLLGCAGRWGGLPVAPGRCIREYAIVFNILCTYEQLARGII